ncbi:hypothetical protein F9C28_17505 [Shimwellia pseudoproteus]|uniref:hypothetical protein n=1 Tax=Shimwellia pseudoproteus TaxID=570012 RepID=UPI0018EDEACD|nr:hypothetical protein [Shimwellia pseudoproteus]MBJ3816659.1 hypothetical protein [Shimwellia pseudoproteus]
MKVNYSILLASLLTSISFGAAADLQCGGYHLHAAENGWTQINGEQVTSQKISFLAGKEDWDNVKTDMGLMPSRDGNNYGFQFIKRDGKSWLNVQLLQASMDAPRVIGSFPCKKVAD